VGQTLLGFSKINKETAVFCGGIIYFIIRRLNDFSATCGIMKGLPSGEEPGSIFPLAVPMIPAGPFQPSCYLSCYLVFKSLT